MSAILDNIITDRLLQFLSIELSLALGAGRSTVSTMTLYYATHIDASLLLKVIDVLGHVFPKNAFILEYFNKIVGRCWSVLRQVEVLRELVKRHRIINEVCEREESLRTGQVVLLKIIIDACAW
jgi:hypothetical protein